MRKLIWMLILTILPYSLVFATTLFDCPDVTIEIEEYELEIANLSAPIAIVKVFNASYNLVYQCNGNCPEEITLDNLSEGEYYIDIQAYTNNWRFICDQKETVIISGNSVSNCSGIDIEVDENELIISGLDAPNKIVKVFDVFYNLIDVCFFNCPKTKVLPNLLAGVYYVDIQLYTENWQFICNRQEEVLIELTEKPCDDSACLGNITLTTQAEVDAFCACSLIEGNLQIGDITENNDIISLANLQQIEQVNGTVSILNTRLDNLSGLGNLGVIGRDLIIIQNPLLKNGAGLNNLVSIGNEFQLKENILFGTLNGLDRWTKVKKLNFQNNPKLSAVKQLAQLTNLQQLAIKDNNRLSVLPDLIVESLSGVILENNAQLKSLSFLAPINYLEGQVIIKNNAVLSDCCGLTHLIDDDPFFGTNNASFMIDNNPFTCTAINTILTNCLPNTSTCDDIRINATTNKIAVAGLTAPNEIIKVFDENYKVIFSCFGDCETAFRLADLSAEIYRIYVNFYNETWIPICETIITVDLNEENASVAFSDRNSTLEEIVTDKIVLSPNPAFGATFLDMKVFKNQSVQLRLVNQFGQEVWQNYIETVSDFPERIAVAQFPNGLYFLQIQSEGKKVVTKKLMVNRLY